MSSNTLILKASRRDLAGLKPNALRAGGNTPAVIHDHGKGSHHIVVAEADLKKIYREAGKHHPVEIDLEGKKFTTLIKEVTHKPGTTNVYHTVLQAVKANETVTAEIPLKLSEEIPAERASLLVVNGITVVEVEALPKDLIDVIEVDASILAEAGDKLHVSDLKVPSTIIIKTDPEAVIASVEVPKDQIAEADAAQAELAADAGVTEEPEAAEEGEATETEAAKEE